MGRLLAYSSPAPSQNWPQSEFPIRAQERWSQKKKQGGRLGVAYFAEISTFATLGAFREVKPKLPFLKFSISKIPP
jgi:hypothetical protein